MVGTDSDTGKAADGVEIDFGHDSVYLVVETDADVDRVYMSALKHG
jgi:hypothetical protein